MRIIERDKEKIAHCERLMAEARDLHLGPSVLATYGIDIFDKNGKQVLKETGKSNSFVRNYYNFLTIHALFLKSSNAAENNAGTFGAGVDTPVKDSAGTNRGGSSSLYLTSNSIDSAVRAGAGVNTHNVQVGSSDTAESFEDFKLAALIPNGTGAGALNYGAAAIASRAFEASTNKLTATHARTFANGSSGNVTIKEIGFGIWTQYGTSVFPYVLVIRDILASPITLTPGQSATISYNLSYIMSN